MESKMKTPAFEEIVAVVEAAKAICGGTIPESEFRNETWMLRLALALLAEFEGEPSKVANSKETIALEDVRAALRAGWISEGGLKPVFEKERTTWTDAILGGVLLEIGRAVCVNADNGELVLQIVFILFDDPCHDRDLCTGKRPDDDDHQIHHDRIIQDIDIGQKKDQRTDAADHTDPQLDRYKYIKEVFIEKLGDIRTQPE